MQILNMASYKFIKLDSLAELRDVLYRQCENLGLKGSILLSGEGINLSLAGTVESMSLFKSYMQNDVRFADMAYKDSYSGYVPFKRLKVKIKKEIITMRCPDIRPETGRAPAISPIELKQWLDEGRDITVLDTRNDYEVQCGTFQLAIHLHIDDFSEFPEASKQLPRDKPIVMFCTGGVRCEKAAVHLLESGFSDVYQLDGGILNYFNEVGGAHYKGNCFVFDERIALDAGLHEAGTE